jgi:hypothetical protein
MNENRTGAACRASLQQEFASDAKLRAPFGRFRPGGILMDNEENEPKLFSLSEAERARREVEPLLIEAMESRRKMEDLDEKLSAVANRILMMGGITVDYESLAHVRAEHSRLMAQVKDALDRIHATGCVVKDLNTGLVDFPAILKNEEVYLCWRLGEDRIRFYHRQDEGFAGRKPIDPEDTGPKHPIQ